MVVWGWVTEYLECTVWKQHNIFLGLYIASLSHRITLIFNALSIPGQFLCFWSPYKPCMHCFFLLLINGEVGQTCNNLNGPHLECTPTLLSTLWMGNVMQWCNILHHHSSAFFSNSWPPLVPEHLTIITTVYCSAPLLTVLQSWYMWTPEKCKNHLCYWWLHFDWKCQMFLFHTLVFTLWFASDTSPSQWQYTNKLQQIVKHLHLCSSVTCSEIQLVEILLKPSFLWMNSWAEPWLKCWWGPLNSHQSIIQNHGMDSFCVCYYHET